MIVIFLQKLKANAGEFGLQILEQLTVPIDYEDFEAENSEVSIALTVTDPHSWVPTFREDDKWDAKFKRMVEVQLGFFLHMNKKIKSKCGAYVITLYRFYPLIKCGHF